MTVNIDYPQFSHSLYSRVVSPYDVGAAVYGYTCSICGTWMPTGGPHVCGLQQTITTTSNTYPPAFDLKVRPSRVPDFTPAMPKRAKRKKQ